MSIKLPHSIENEDEEHFSKEEEDAIVITMSEQFADWVASFLRRVITLFENLPEEGGITGTAGGQTERQSNHPIICIAADALCSEPRRCRMRCIQSNLRTPFRPLVRYGIEHGIRLREHQRPNERRPRYSPAC